MKNVVQKIKLYRILLSLNKLLLTKYIPSSSRTWFNLDVEDILSEINVNKDNVVYYHTDKYNPYNEIISNIITLYKNTNNKIIPSHYDNMPKIILYYDLNIAIYDFDNGNKLLLFDNKLIKNFVHG